jgi:UDP-sulfoquinovose synthase
MQSVVFGIYTDEIDQTKQSPSRFDSDEAFGTVINRFILQTVLDQPLTVYGYGEHQRGFLSLNDSVQALMIAVENEPEIGETRV